MSNVGSVSAPSYVTSGSNLVDPAGMSPDALLEYCGMQLNGLDSQIGTMMNQQQSQLSEQTAVQQVQTTLEGFGSNGPQSGADMQKCVDAFNTAISSLPPGDPIATQLQAQCTQMESQFGFTAPQTLTPAEQVDLTQAQATVAAGPLGTAGGALTWAAAQATVTQMTSIQNGNMSSPPANGQWQGTTDALGNLASDVKSNAEMQMLQLQDLVSQRQDVIEMSTNMMSTEDSALLDGAKAV